MNSLDQLREQVQEQVNLMYASAKYAEDMHGKNVTSYRLRQFADRLGEALAESHATPHIYEVDCGCCGPWIRRENGLRSEFPTKEDALKGDEK